MNNKTTLIIVLALLIISLIAGSLLWNQLPDKMASHWDVNDQVNGYMSKFWGIFFMPVMTLGIVILFMLIPSIDPLKANIAKFRQAFNLFIVLITAFLSYMWVLTILWNLGYTHFRMGSAMLPAMGLLFIYMGYMLRTAKRNFFIGIRTPWTLSSDSVWEKTHQLGSVLFMIAGALSMIGGLFGDYAIWFVMVPLLGSSLFLVIYSYILYQQETRS